MSSRQGRDANTAKDLPLQSVSRRIHLRRFIVKRRATSRSLTPPKTRGFGMTRPGRKIGPASEKGDFLEGVFGTAKQVRIRDPNAFFGIKARLPVCQGYFFISATYGLKTRHYGLGWLRCDADGSKDPPLQGAEVAGG